MSRRIRVLCTLVLVVGVVAYISYRLATSREWQQFQAGQFWQSLNQVRLPYILLAAALIFASYFSRCLRWQVFLRPRKTGSLRNILVSTLIGFSAVALLGRPGEAVRPLLIARKEGLTVSSQFGAWTLERVFDSLTLGTLLGAALLFFPPQNVSETSGAEWMARLRTAGILLWVGALLLADLMALLHYWPHFGFRILDWFTQPLPERYRASLRKMVGHFSACLASITDAYRFLVCLFYSLLVWITLLLSYWYITRAFGWPLNSLELGAVVVVLGAGATGSLASLPGIGGGTQVATALALTELFGVPLAMASSAAILLWALTFMMVLIPGLPLAAREGLTWQRLRTLTKSGT